MQDLNTIKTIVEIGNDAITAIGIIIGGVWAWMLFVKKRQQYPRAKIEHRISHHPITSDKLLLSIEVIIANCGEVLIPLKLMNLTLNQISPPTGELFQIIKEGYTGEVVLHETIVPPLKQEWEKPREIEPGESDQFHFNFILDSSIQKIAVYSDFQNAAKGKRRGQSLFWQYTTVYNVMLPASGGQKVMSIE